MKSNNFGKKWKYFAKSPAVVSSEISLHRVVPDTLDPSRLHPEIKPAKTMIISAIKTRTHLKKMKGGRA